MVHLSHIHARGTLKLGITPSHIFIPFGGTPKSTSHHFSYRPSSSLLNYISTFTFYSNLSSY